jgi:tetratricopeptide (TPR) repeat protein
MDADVGVLLDADVLVCGALDRWIEEIADGDMLHGLPGHFSPFYYSPSGRPHRESWEAIFREAGLPAPRFDMQHLGWEIIHTDVPEESEMRYSPTFFNLGVLAARPDVLAAVGSSIYDAMEAVDRFQQTFFKCQIGLTLAMALHGIRGALLAARYNFLNTPEMFDKLPEEAADVRIFHFNQPADIDKVRDFASYGRLQKALRREGLHAVNRILVERLRTLHYDRVLKDLQAVGMELPVEPDVDHWDVRQAVQRARASVDCGSYEEALDALTPVESHLTEDGHAQYLLGYTKHALGRDRLAAIEHYGNALRCRFDEFWVRYNRGALALDLDLRAQALEDLSRARALQPDHPGPITLLSALTPT